MAGIALPCFFLRRRSASSFLICVFLRASADKLSFEVSNQHALARNLRQ